MLTVKVTLPEDRRQTGTISVIENDAVRLGPFECLGKADNAAASKHGNPSRDPTYPFGDTPLGQWLIKSVLATATPGLPERSYGPNGALDLEPVSGACAIAYSNGRHGIWVHGGDLSTAGKLRPTNGCIRLANEDLEEVIAFLRPALKNGRVPMSVIEE